MVEQRKAKRGDARTVCLGKRGIESEYSTFATQYDELKVRITNDSLQQKLEQEKLRTQQLLEELKQTKATDAAEITRLKRSLKQFVPSCAVM